MSNDTIELPRDMDGKPIRIGDWLVSDHMGHEEFRVDGIGWHDGHGVVFHTAGHCLNGWTRFNAELCRHDSEEAFLARFIADWNGVPEEEVSADNPLIERYARMMRRG